MLQTDSSPILGDGAPISTAGMVSTTRLADLLEITFELEPATARNSRGWGPNCLDATLILACWRMITNNKNGKPTMFKFDISESQAPVIIGLDVKRYCDNININCEHTLCMLRPENKTEKLFNTYISVDDCKNDKLRIELLPHSKTRHVVS